TTAVTSRWGARGTISTSPPSAARNSGRTRQTAIRRHRRTSGGTTTTRTTRRDDHGSERHITRTNSYPRRACAVCASMGTDAGRELDSVIPDAAACSTPPRDPGHDGRSFRGHHVIGRVEGGCRTGRALSEFHRESKTNGGIAVAVFGPTGRMVLVAVG